MFRRTGSTCTWSLREAANGEKNSSSRSKCQENVNQPAVVPTWRRRTRRTPACAATGAPSQTGRNPGSGTRRSPRCPFSRGRGRGVSFNGGEYGPCPRRDTLTYDAAPRRHVIHPRARKDGNGFAGERQHETSRAPKNVLTVQHRSASSESQAIARNSARENAPLSRNMHMNVKNMCAVRAVYA